jgi:hypothetical protein
VQPVSYRHPVWRKKTPAQVILMTRSQPIFGMGRRRTDGHRSDSAALPTQATSATHLALSKMASRPLCRTTSFDRNCAKSMRFLSKCVPCAPILCDRFNVTALIGDIEGIGAHKSMRHSALLVRNTQGVSVSCCQPQPVERLKLRRLEQRGFDRIDPGESRGIGGLGGHR